MIKMVSMDISITSSDDNEALALEFHRAAIAA